MSKNDEDDNLNGLHNAVFNLMPSDNFWSCDHFVDINVGIMSMSGQNRVSMINYQKFL